MNYTTQMDAASKGIVTPQMKDVLERESITQEKLLQLMSEGKIALPANKNHKNLRGIAIGTGLTTKVNVNLGVSEDCYNLDMEMKKVNAAIEMKTDAIMDLSTFGDTQAFRKKLVETSPVMLGTVPIYDTVTQHINKPIKDITVDEWFEIAERHANDGIDFLTIHAGLTKVVVERIKKNMRLTHVVSRGGSILMEWMEENNAENPFYEYFDRLLDICVKYDVTISIGDGLRPGSLKDSTDAPQIQELIFLGELTKQAWERKVQVMIEGPGHVPLNEIVTNMQLQKKLCHGAPFYVLGPLVTDIAPGYDHITSAIGGAIAASNGADFLCYVTPAEHLRLPDLDDMKEGVIASRIAAHAADIALGIPGAMDWDNAMSKARVDLDWKAQIDLAIDPEKAKAYRESAAPLDEDVCSMCGEFCAIKRSNKVLKGK
ncbi:MAG: phosphomethylpyrimidine synthase ThiC [Candidatus Delongbacteria bacterium]|jgi:phosphomethylpyrimidine synthase|nr:phosphomethylpyrimidine synthase ThiC [Candidatus Delongbacteria bacterium]